MANDLTPDEQRLQSLLQDPKVPDDAKRRAVQLYREMGGSAATSTTTTPNSADVAQADAQRAATQSASEQQFGRGIAETVGGVLGGTLATPAGPIGQVGGAGLGMGLGGQAFDALAQLFGTQQPKSLKDTAKDVGADFLSGAKAEMGGQIIGSLVGKGIDATLGKIADRRARRLAMEARKAAFAEQGIQPMASDLTQSRAVGQIENAPGAFFTGSGPLQSMRETQIGQATKAAERTLNPSGPTMEPIAAGTIAKQGVETAAADFQKRTGPLFDQIEAEAGDAALVSTAPFREAIDALLAKRARLGMGAGAAGKTDAGLKILGGDKELNVLVDQAGRAEKIPYWMARELESRLGELSRAGKTQYIRGARQGEVVPLYVGIRDGIKEFLDSAGDGGLSPRLSALRQDYRIGKQLFDESLAKNMEGKTGEDAFRAIFNPTAVTELLDYRTAVPDDVWKQSVDAWKGGLLAAARDASTGAVKPTTLAREIDKFDRGGTLDIIAGNEADQIRGLAKVLRQMGGAERATMGGNPSGTASALTNSMILAAPAAAITRAVSGGFPGLLAGAAGAAGSTLVPYGAARIVTSPAGVNALSRAATPVFPNLGQLLGPEGLRPLAQWLGAQ